MNRYKIYERVFNKSMKVARVQPVFRVQNNTKRHPDEQRERHRRILEQRREIFRISLVDALKKGENDY